jgi:hypothetical protein
MRGTILSAAGATAAALIGLILGAIIVREAATSDLQAIVEENGTVVLCLAKGQIPFADRCSGIARLTIVQPIKEGPIVWRSAIGRIEMENDAPQNPGCALGRAKWDRTTEAVVASGRRIEKLDPAAITTSRFPIPPDLHSGDLRGFQLDLDGDGIDESVFAYDNTRVAHDRHEKTGTESTFLVLGAIMSTDPARSFPHLLHHESGAYAGATDAIGAVRLKGVVQIDPASGEIAVLVESGAGYLQDLVRYRGEVQRLQTILRRCD